MGGEVEMKKRKGRKEEIEGERYRVTRKYEYK